MNKMVKKLVAAGATISALCASSVMMVCAEDAGTKEPNGGNNWSGWLMIILYVLFFAVIGYFLIYRPNKKRKQQEEQLRNGLMLGDQIVTIGGICGTIVNIKDDVITIESSLDRTLIEFKNWAIREVKKAETAESTDSAKETESK